MQNSWRRILLTSLLILLIQLLLFFDVINKHEISYAIKIPYAIIYDFDSEKEYYSNSIAQVAEGHLIIVLQ